MPVTEFNTPDPYSYLSGFNNHHETESVSGALPIGQNSPQKPPLGLYAEKLSGSSFTAPRRENHQTWLYRILPACARHSSFRSYEDVAKEQGNGYVGSTWDLRVSGRGKEAWLDVPNQLRWDPFKEEGEETKVDWVKGLKLLAGQGDPVMKSGLGIYVYNFQESMAANTAFYSADGDFLIVPQRGALNITTELGKLMVRPCEICVIPRGVRYRVDLVEEEGQTETGARGYVLELFEQGHFELPELGPIGSNGLANAADFQCPVASYEDDEGKGEEFKLYAKFGGRLFVAEQDHTPFDVVAVSHYLGPDRYTYE
jgi:homogentisate 1,2-dioxygenase